MIRIVRDQATVQQIAEMMQQLDNYVKLAVHVRRGVLAGGGALHADCETVLLEDGSKQEDVWGADWYPAMQEVTFESLINLRPAQANFSMEIQDEDMRARVKEIVVRLLGGV